eukprot:TRINITY_DN12036_c0_g1_i1.p1 TRINITY_DN12036_c0_g1~~TRINITY_DN12036_c0_g1_i1.p1  ORF type:complete len:705 (-),score=187.46 TRINITY_DN12036_c0_g1_i1:134-2248(-)
MMTDHSETADRMEEWEDQIVTENEEHFNISSDDNEIVSKNKNDSKLKKFQSGFTKRVMSTLREDTKVKGGMMIQIFKEEWKSNRTSPDRPMSGSAESLQSIKDEPFNESEKDSESKDIREDFVDIRDESLHSFNELKETYQEKAEQKKAMMTSFTEEEVKIFRKGSPLPPHVTKQMSSVYLARRFSIIRFTILGARKLDTSRVKPADNIFVKLSLGMERFKTRPVPAFEEPQWLETSSLPRQSEEDEDLLVEMIGRGSKETTILGTAAINLGSLKTDSQTRVWLKLDGDLGDCELEMVVWVTGVKVDNDNKWLIEEANKIKEDNYNLSKSFEDLSDVGFLDINVIEATGLGSTKLQGSVNPFCQLELDNQFHRTVTAIKTKNPTWDKKFSFRVIDPFSELNISVVSEKINSPDVLLGRAVIRLSSLHGTSGYNTLWVALKDRKLRKMAKGDSPKLHLEISFVQNKIRSAITVFQNKDDLLFEVPKVKFDRTVLSKNVSRLKQFLPKGSTMTKIKTSYSDIIAWKDPPRTVKYFLFYMFIVYHFQIWWVPVFLLYHLFINLKNKKSGKSRNIPRIVVKGDLGEDEDDEEEESQEGKKSLKQSLDSLQNILLEFQVGCGLVASYFERISNLCHFEEPFLTFLFCGLLVIVSLVLWCLGLRTLLLLWGVNKFTKKLRDADPVPTNELDNLILRVPDFEMVEDAKLLE